MKNKNKEDVPWSVRVDNDLNKREEELKYKYNTRRFIPLISYLNIKKLINWIKTRKKTN